MMTNVPLCRLHGLLSRAVTTWLRPRSAFVRDVTQATGSFSPRRLNGLPACSHMFVQNLHSGKKKKIPPTKPLNFDYGGDLEKSLPSFNLGGRRPGYEDVEELDSANEEVKKIFSLEYADGTEVRDKYVQDMLSKYKEHPADTRSLEVRVAWLTVLIRNQIKHCLDFRKDKVSKSQLIRRIQARHKLLNKLRWTDYDRFQWICDELKVKFIPHHIRAQKKLSKREQRIKIAQEKNQAIIEAKMEAFREQLEIEKQIFEREKKVELEKIEKELKEMGLDETSSLAQTAHALRMGHVILDEKPVSHWRRPTLGLKFELYKDRKYRKLPEYLVDIFKKRDEQKERVNKFYREEKRKQVEAAEVLKSSLLKSD